MIISIELYFIIISCYVPSITALKDWQRLFFFSNKIFNMVMKNCRITLFWLTYAIFEMVICVTSMPLPTSIISGVPTKRTKLCSYGSDAHSAHLSAELRVPSADDYSRYTSTLLRHIAKFTMYCINTTLGSCSRLRKTNDRTCLGNSR